MNSHKRLLRFVFPSRGMIAATWRWFIRGVMAPLEALILFWPASWKPRVPRDTLCASQPAISGPPQPGSEGGILSVIGRMCATRDRGSHRGFDLELCLRHEAWGGNPDLVFSLFSVLQGAGNLSLTWEAQAPAAVPSEPQVLREATSVGERSQAMADLADTARLLCIPESFRASTRGYLRRFGRHTPLIAVSTDVAGHGPDAERDAHWARFFHAVHLRYPDALILVLNRLSDRSTRPFASYVRIVQDVGFGTVEALAVAQQADAYIGDFDAYGGAAWAAGIAGIYVPGRTLGDTSQTPPPAPAAANQTWFSAGSIFEEGLASLDALMQHHPVRSAHTGGAPESLKAEAHGFLKIWDKRDFVVALNPVGVGLSLGASGLAHSVELAASIRNTRADAVICLLGPVSDELAPSLSGTSALWTTSDFGSSPRDYAMLARCADAYVGVLDDCGRLALDGGRPGIYAERGIADGVAEAGSVAQRGAPHRGEPPQWVIGRLEPEACASCVRDLVAHCAPSTGR